MALLSKKSAEDGKKESKISPMRFHWLYRVYFAGVSAVAIIVMSVNLGILITSIGKYLLITPQEYLLSDQAWEYKDCSSPKYIENETVDKTEDEIVACQEKASKNVLANRSINLKETFIESFAWLVVFWILFAFHYPKFIALREEK